MMNSGLAYDHLGPIGITGIVLLGIAVILWITLLCACFRIRCLLKAEVENELKEMEQI